MRLSIDFGALDEWRYLVIDPLPFDDFDGLDARLLSLLAQSERARYSSIVPAARRRRSLRARAALRVTLGELLGMPPQDLDIQSDMLGRPYLVHPEAHSFSFNVTHSGDHVLVALSRFGSIGIDVQTGVKNPERIARRFFGPEVTAWITGLPIQDRPLAFARIWSIGEAIAKSMGRGPWTLSPQIEIPPPDRGRWEGIEWSTFGRFLDAAITVAFPIVEEAPERGSWIPLSLDRSVAIVAE